MDFACVTATSLRGERRSWNALRYLAEPEERAEFQVGLRFVQRTFLRRTHVAGLHTCLGADEKRVRGPAREAVRCILKATVAGAQHRAVGVDKQRRYPVGVPDSVHGG